MHLDDHTLHALIDDALADTDHTRAAAHLRACAGCRARRAVMQTRAARVNARLSALAPRAHESARAPSLAFAQFDARRQTIARKDDSTMSKLFTQRFRPLWVALGAIALLTIALSFAPVRAWAGQFLELFRVQTITVLPIDSNRLNDLATDKTLGKDISQLFSDSVKVTKEAGKPQTVASAAEASQLAGFPVRLLSNTAPTKITMQARAAFEFVVNRARAQAILDEAGNGNLKLPASIDGAVIAVDIPASVLVTYGNCPDLSKGEPSTARGKYTNCVILTQSPSPTVNTPPDLNVEELAEIGLQFSGMSAAEARAFSQATDWTSTLVIPIPRNGHAYKQVQVDGVTGNLIQRNPDDGEPAHYALLWVKNGIVYALSGIGNGNNAAAVGNTLQ